jgi:hypothetical protein
MGDEGAGVLLDEKQLGYVVAGGMDALLLDHADGVGSLELRRQISTRYSFIRVLFKRSVQSALVKFGWR